MAQPVELVVASVTAITGGAAAVTLEELPVDVLVAVGG